MRIYGRRGLKKTERIGFKFNRNGEVINAENEKNEKSVLIT